MLITLKIVLFSFQIAAFLVAILNFKNLNTVYKYFAYFMVYVVCHEITGFVFSNILKTNNYFLYNNYILISFLFYFFWFRQILVKRATLIKVFSLVFVASFVYSVFAEDYWNAFYRTPLTIGTIFVLVSVIFYFVELLSEDGVVNYLSLGEFWFATGLLIFHVGFIPLYLLQSIIKASLSYTIAITVLNVVMYGCFIQGFLCTKRK